MEQQEEMLLKELENIAEKATMTTNKEELTLLREQSRELNAKILIANGLSPEIPICKNDYLLKNEVILEKNGCLNINEFCNKIDERLKVKELKDDDSLYNTCFVSSSLSKSLIARIHAVCKVKDIPFGTIWIFPALPSNSKINGFVRLDKYYKVTKNKDLAMFLIILFNDGPIIVVSRDILLGYNKKWYSKSETVIDLEDFISSCL
jgi:hypothetical protein